MYHRAEILSLQKNNFIYKKKKHYNAKVTYFSIVLVVLVLSIIGGKILFAGSQIVSSLNPIFSPYVETGNMIFTDLDYKLESKELNFITPVNYKEYQIYENEIVFELLLDNVVKSVEDGVVLEVEKAKDNNKYIKVLHCDNHISVYENIDVCGVEVGLKVSKGDQLATAKNNKVKLVLLKDESPLVIDKIFDNHIICK